MSVEKIKLTEAQEGETYLPTLYGKALDYRSAGPILGDKYADEVVRRIDLDWDRKFKRIAGGGQYTLPLRAKHFDTWTQHFLDAHPSATVLNLGCGLDSRVFRMDPPTGVRWYDVDLPDVVALRKRLYPERHDYELIATSVTDLGWLDPIPGDRPVAVTAEGLMQYLAKKDAAALFTRITDQFPSGQIAFDAYGTLTVRFLNLAIRLSMMFRKPTAAGSPVVLPWGFDDPQVLEREVPRLKLAEAVPFLTNPELVKRMSRSRAQAAFGRWLGKMQWYRNSMRHYRYEF
jgi:O-methyltransferase involved in polyketide biosynthesis